MVVRPRRRRRRTRGDVRRHDANHRAARTIRRHVVQRPRPRAVARRRKAKRRRENRRGRRTPKNRAEERRRFGFGRRRILRRGTGPERSPRVRAVDRGGTGWRDASARGSTGQRPRRRARGRRRRRRVRDDPRRVSTQRSHRRGGRRGGPRGEGVRREREREREGERKRERNRTVSFRILDCRGREGVRARRQGGHVALPLRRRRSLHGGADELRGAGVHVGIHAHARLWRDVGTAQGGVPLGNVVRGGGFRGDSGRHRFPGRLGRVRGVRRVVPPRDGHLSGTPRRFLLRTVRHQRDGG